MIDYTVGGGFRELSLTVRPRRHSCLAWWGASTFRTVHGRRVACVMWRGRTIWIRRA